MKKIASLLIVAIALTLFSVPMLESCSDDSDSFEGETLSMQLVPYGQSFVEEETPATRALINGYQNFLPDSGSVVVYMVNDEDCYKNGNFTAKSSWTSTVKALYSNDYYIYGFYPGDLVHQESITSEDYTQGAKLTFPGLSTFSDVDICMITGVGSLGNFEYSTPASGTCTINYLYLDHLCSSLVLNIQVDSAYNEVRTIQLQEVKLRLSASYEKETATVTLKSNAEGINPKSIVWTGEGASSEVSSFNLVSPAPRSLTTDYQTLKEVFIPGTETGSLSVDIVSTYNVCDKKGTLVRENCQAVNSISLTKVTPGNRNRIWLTVQPTYLYQLSDPDLDNPTIVVKK